jgi:hypothetical protein
MAAPLARSALAAEGHKACGFQRQVGWPATFLLHGFMFYKQIFGDDISYNK